MFLIEVSATYCTVRTYSEDLRFPFTLATDSTPRNPTQEQKMLSNRLPFTFATKINSKEPNTKSKMLVNRVIMNHQLSRTPERLLDVSPLPKQSRGPDGAVPTTIFLPSTCLPEHQSERLMARRSRPRQSRSFQERSFVVPSFVSIPFARETLREDSCSQRCGDPRDETHSVLAAYLHSKNKTRWEEQGNGHTTKSRCSARSKDEASYELPPTPPSRKSSFPDLFDTPESTLCDPTPPKMPQRLPPRPSPRRHSDPLVAAGGLPLEIPVRTTCCRRR